MADRNDWPHRRTGGAKIRWILPSVVVFWGGDRARRDEAIGRGEASRILAEMENQHLSELPRPYPAGFGGVGVNNSGLRKGTDGQGERRGRKSVGFSHPLLCFGEVAA